MECRGSLFKTRAGKALTVAVSLDLLPSTRYFNLYFRRVVLVNLGPSPETQVGELVQDFAPPHGLVSFWAT